MKVDFSGRTALVTGASRGIGHRIAVDLNACGAELVLTSTSESDGPRLIDEFGPDTRHLAVDFSDRESRNAFLASVAALPSLHVCINNAGLTRHGPSDRVTENDWDVTQDVNLKAPFLVSQAAARIMKREGYGRIVNISSIWAHMTMADRSIYTAAKFGMRGMTETFAVELAPSGILVNCVAPGFTLTDMARKSYSAERMKELSARVPLGRMAEVQDISSAVLFLASGLNTYITGQSLVVDGGYCIA